ncbi:MAG TPA: type II secretion system F family protein [Acidobacteriaceae bacterium]|nr:type II secretion system F family protein [Acidobacteriaceae bacterium]
MNLILISFVVMLALSFGVLVLCTRTPSASANARQRLEVIQESVRPQNVGLYGGVLKDAERNFGARAGELLERYEFAQRFKQLLIHANSTMDVGDAVLVSAGCAFVAGAAGFLFLGSVGMGAVLAAVGSAIPCGWFRYKRSSRVKSFGTALPDAIDLMARSLRAGHAMGSAIEMVADQAPDPVGPEFFQVYQQQRLGLQFRDALLQMGDRVPSRDLQFLITAILVQKETGGDLTDILDRASYVIRERVRIEGEVRTHTAQGRLTGWILALLPIVMLGFINLVSPGYSTVLFHDPIGKDLCYAGGGMILVGGLIIRKIVDVKV